jgi:hypothetical protein
MTLSITTLYHYAEYSGLFVVLLSVIWVNAAMLCVVLLIVGAPFTAHKGKKREPKMLEKVL